MKRMLVIVAVITVSIVIVIFAGPGEDTRGVQSRIPGTDAAAPQSDVPEIMNYQAVLTDQSGDLLHGTFDLVFRIYDQETAPGGNEMWMEPHFNVQVDSGLVNILLGTVNPGLAESFDGSGRWLEVEVQGQILTPRQPIASVPYAFRSGDGGGGDGHSLDAADGSPVDAVYVDDTGIVGIGTTSPASKTALHIAENTPLWLLGTPPYAQLKISGTTEPDNQLRLGFHTREDFLTEKHGFIEAAYWSTDESSQFPLVMNDELCVAADGNVGIGTWEPERDLHIKGRSGNAAVRLESEGGNQWNVAAGEKFYVSYYDGSFHDYLTVDEEIPLRVRNFDGSTCLRADANEGVSIGSGTETPPSEGLFVKGGVQVGKGNADEWTALYLYGDHQWLLNAHNQGDFLIRHNRGSAADPDWDDRYFRIRTSGEVVVPVLELTGGSDIAEPFDVAQPESVEPGMVVVIDPEHPGRLKRSSRAYDRCVAGIVSGANGVRPGMTMVQENAFEGNHQVALTGRVYGLCDASYGSIEPGDLLTTSPTPGYAMKVTDYEKAPGAVIGKAMSRLEDGQDFVLVLVNLQ